MKKTMLFSALLLVAAGACCQNSDVFSVEVGNSWYHYFWEHKNGFNYGFSLTGSMTKRGLKVSAGISYAFRQYKTENIWNYRDPWFCTKYELKYLRYPVIASIGVLSSDKYSIRYFAGIEFRQITDYNIITVYRDESVRMGKGALENRWLGVDLETGMTFSLSIAHGWEINLSPFVEYNLVADHVSQGYDNRNIPEDKLLAGVRLGVEYIFNTQEK